MLFFPANNMLRRGIGANPVVSRSSFRLISIPPFASPPCRFPDVPRAAQGRILRRRGSTRVIPQQKTEVASGFATPLKQQTYHQIEDTEDLRLYEPGGLHPIHIGDVLNSRYSIAHKLGYGGWSTIWLARDQEVGQYVAIKVTLADTRSREIAILQELQSSEAHPSHSMIRKVLDHFVVRGPNGEHDAMVTAPALMSLRESKEVSKTKLFQLPVARAIAAQLVQAMKFLHHSGFVHGGKQQLSPEELYARYKQPCYRQIKRLDGGPLQENVPTRCPLPMWLGRRSEELSVPQSRIFLNDFGVSFSPLKERRTKCYINYTLWPPESIFLPDEPLSFPSDIWSLACALWSLVAQSDLFSPWCDPTAEQVEVLGKLPAEWWARWKDRDYRFDEDGSVKGIDPCRTWERRFEECVREPRERAGMEMLQGDEKAAFLALLQSMLKYWPDERASIGDVWESEWMTKWAIPELEKL